MIYSRTSDGGRLREPLMVEINRRLYMDEGSGAKLPAFAAVAATLQDCI